ncbi:MAG: beta strand repeat-containing protein, partial [Nitrospiria bacterium]
MYDTYRFKHSAALALEQNTYDQFFYGTLFFSVFLYLFSFYFIYQTTEILKHLQSGSTVQTISTTPHPESVLRLKGEQTIVPPVQLPPQVIPQTRVKSIGKPAAAPPFDVAKAIEKAAHRIKPASPALDILPFSYAVHEPSYEVNFGESTILFKQKRPSAEKTDLKLELESIRSGEQVFYPASQSKKKKPLVKENKVSYQKSADIKELYESRSNGLEQSWVFKRPVSREKGRQIVVTQKLATSLTPRYGLGGVIDFYDSKGNYITTYGKGTLKDSSGNSVDVLPQLKGGPAEGTYRLVMAIPGKWLAQASYPVVLDPLIGNKQQVDSLNLTNGDSYPSVAFDGTNYVVVWMAGPYSSLNGGIGAVAPGSDIYGAVVSPNGTVVVAATDLTPVANDQMYPSVTYNSGTASFLVVYQNYINTTNQNDIYGLVVTYSGNAFTLGTPTAIVSSSFNEQFSTVATDGANSSNNFYVAYVTTTGAGSTVNAVPVYATTTGAAITPGTPVNLATVIPNAAAPSVLPQIAYSNTANNYLITWEDFGTDTSGNIYANTLAKGAATPGTVLGVAVTASMPERYPTVAFDGTNFLTGYQKGATGGSADIYAQLVTTANALSGTAFGVSTVASSDQTNPKVAYNGTEGVYLFAWTDARNNSTSPDIYGARVSAAGSILDASGVNISNIGTSVKKMPAVSAGGPNDYVAWRDSATNTGNIYGQLVGPPQIASLSPTTVEARNPVTITSILYGSSGTFGPDPGSANRSTTTNNVTIGGYQIGNADVTAWGLTSGVNSSIGITAPYAAAVSGGTGVGTAIITSAGWASTPSASLTIQDYSLSLLPATATVVQGNSASYTVTMATTNGYSSTTNLSMSSSGPCPSGATCGFSPSGINGSGSTSTLTIATTTSTLGGTYTPVVQGIGGTNNQITHTASATLVVNPLPTVITGSASAISQTGATLNGTVNPNGVAATAWFEYGTTTGYGSSTATTSIAAGTTAVSVSSAISSLTVNTLYHFRLDASNTYGTNHGTDATFTTLASAPAVTTLAATAIGSTTSTLNGSVNTNGVTANGWFEYGTSATYGTTTATQALAAGTNVAFSQALTGLTANTLYHFRAGASNTGGTGYGSDATFTTLASAPAVTTLAATAMGSTTSTLNGSVNTNGVTANGWFEYGLSATYGTTTATQALAAGTNVTFAQAISGLTTNTVYHFRAGVSNNGGTGYGSDATFTTLAGLPAVTTLAATAIGSTTSTLNGSVNTNGVTANGWFEYGTSATYGTTTASQALAAGTNVVFAQAITGLTANTVYHFRAGASNNGGTGYGLDANFTTLASGPAVTTGSATSITSAGATLNGSVNPNGVTATAWFEYGLSATYGSSTAAQSIAAGTIAVAVSAGVTGLSANTTYHFRLDATNNGGPGYGADNTFTTLATPPAVTTGSATSIGSSTVTLNGSVNPNGVTATAWFEYGLSATYGSSTASQSLAAGTIAVAVSAAVTGLSGNTVYHFRLDAANNGGTSNGLDGSFTTLAALPTVTTSPATAISQTGATLNGSVNPNGVTATAWFEYGLSTAYGSSTAAQSIAAGNTAVAISAAITALSVNTSYHYRVDATNNGGTSYSADASYTTLANAPVVTTGSATTIASNSATLNGSVNPNGVTTTSWFEYGLSATYGSSTASQSLAAGTSAVAVSASVTGLTGNTAYHFRIDASNNGGPSYGADAMFTTLANPPAVATSPATSIATTTATLNGTVNPNGVTATAWFEYGLSATYGSSTASQALAVGSSAVAVSAAISGLSANATYHFRIDATNNGGTSYGLDATFTTLASGPTVTTGSATSITSSGATLNGSVNPNGVTATAWFEYGLSATYGSSTASQALAAGSSAVAVSAAISGLSVNTTYHFRIDATNNGGPSYGADNVFTTLSSGPAVTTGSATSITSAGATLNGSVNPNGVTATAWFEYGLSATYGSSTASQSLAAGSTAVAVSAAVTGLSVNTVYHFRLDAANNGGTSYGLDASFTTLATPPVVTTGSATGVGGTSATLNGSVNPNGVTAAAWFEYGLSATYGSSTASQSLAAGSSAVAVSAAISGLSVNTTYHFRIDANNNGGTSLGADNTFTTLANAPVVTTGSATSITSSGATLNGSVNPNGVTATAWFEYGLSGTYGTTTANQSLAAGSTAV